MGGYPVFSGLRRWQITLGRNLLRRLSQWLEGKALRGMVHAGCKNLGRIA